MSENVNTAARRGVVFISHAAKTTPIFLLGASLLFFVVLLLVDEPWAQLATFGNVVFLALAFASGLLVLLLATVGLRKVGAAAVLGTWILMVVQMMSPAWIHGPMFAFHLGSVLFDAAVAGLWLLNSWRAVNNHERRYSLSFRSRIARNSGKVNAIAVTVDSTT